jgi:hypothetical protein
MAGDCQATGRITASHRIPAGGLSPKSKPAQHLRQGMKDRGHTEGRDVSIEWRSTEGDYDRVQKLIDEFVQNKVDVIVVNSTVADPSGQAHDIDHSHRHGLWSSTRLEQAWSRAGITGRKCDRGLHEREGTHP